MLEDLTDHEEMRSPAKSKSVKVIISRRIFVQRKK
jgi:hypothetical protein